MEENKTENAQSRNIPAAILKLFAVLFMISSSYGSFYIACQGYGFNTGLFWGLEVGTLTIGMLAFGIGEIIDLLQSIKDKLK